MSGGRRVFAPGYYDNDGCAHKLGTATVVRSDAEAETLTLREKESYLLSGNPDRIITVTRFEHEWVGVNP